MTLITQEELDELLAHNPRLEGNGFAPFSTGSKPSRIDLKQVDLALRWLDYHGRRTTINPDYCSYGLKHHAEKTAPALRPGAIPYISNGAFIAAALYYHYKVSQIRGTPNARINIRFYKTSQDALLKKVASA